MKYAPIYIPTLCRSEHFIRLMESLRKNTWAKYTDVYIALDYPAKDSQKDGYNKICEYLKEDFTEFASFNLIKRGVVEIQKRYWNIYQVNMIVLLEQMMIANFLRIFLNI